jgi:hypothetical protein
MKIYRVVQAGGTPPGYVDIKFTYNPDGTSDARIASRGEGTSCLTEDDAAILQDLMSGDIPGFGGVGAVTDMGHTSEYFEAKKKKQKPQAVPQQPAVPFGGDIIIETPKAKERQSLGMDF